MNGKDREMLARFEERQIAMHSVLEGVAEEVEELSKYGVASDKRLTLIEERFSNHLSVHKKGIAVLSAVLTLIASAVVSIILAVI